MTKFTLELDYEMREKIVKQSLLEDWELLNNDIRNLKSKRKSSGLSDIEKEDLKGWKRYRNGVKKMIEYHFWAPEAEKIIKGKGRYVCEKFDY